MENYDFCPMRQTRHQRNMMMMLPKLKVLSTCFNSFWKLQINFLIKIKASVAQYNNPAYQVWWPVVSYAILYLGVICLPPERNGKLPMYNAWNIKTAKKYWEVLFMS
jgi:hypothetical protein